MYPPQDSELVFQMSNTMKTRVKFKTKAKYGDFVRFAGKLAPTESLQRKANSRVMVPVAESKITGWEGACAALSAMYLRKSHELGLAVKRPDVEQSFQIHLAQAAFEMWDNSDYSQRRERLLELMGMKVSDKGIQVTVAEMARTVGNKVGRYMVSLRYDDGAGHMIGIRNAGGAFYYFEPNEGLYHFGNFTRFTEAMEWVLLGEGSGMTRDSISSWWATELA